MRPDGVIVAAGAVQLYARAHGSLIRRWSTAMARQLLVTTLFAREKVFYLGLTFLHHASDPLKRIAGIGRQLWPFDQPRFNIPAPTFSMGHGSGNGMPPITPGDDMLAYAGSINTILILSSDDLITAGLRIRVNGFAVRRRC